MMRCFWKRWVLAGVCGSGVLVGMAAAQKGGPNVPSGPPKVGDVLTLPFANGVERQVKVIKSEKQPDGSYLSEVKDTKTGETITLYDKPVDGVPDRSARPEPQKPTTAKSSPRPADPLLPKPGMAAEQPKEKEEKKDRRFLGNLSIFSPKPPSPETPAPAPAQEEERPGLLKRIFGKKPSPPSANMPGTTTTTSTKPAAPGLAPGAGAGGAMPPAVRPTPATPRTPATGPNTPPPAPGGTAEPPRSRPGESTTPPRPVTSVPVSPPSSSPPPIASPGSSGTTVPSTPVIPVVPSAPPASTPVPGGLPTIPVPPGGLSSVKSAVVQTGYAGPATPAARAEVLEDIREHATTLRTGPAPSKRAFAARALAGGRHCSSDTVKAMLFGTAQDDPSTMVRAVCIEELGKLGYREPAFLTFLKMACDDLSADVSNAAKDALGKLAPGK